MRQKLKVQKTRCAHTAPFFMKHHKSGLTSSFAASAVALTSLSVNTALAEYSPDTDFGTTLEGIGVYTENQLRTADGVRNACRSVSALGSRTALQEDLRQKCAAMVGTGNAIDPDAPTVPAGDLETNADGLGDILQSVSNEELAATNSIANDFSAGQTKVAISRLNAVRSGVRFGLNGTDTFDAITFNDPRQQAEWAATGGAAGDPLTGPWGFFANVKYNFGDREKTDFEDGFDYHTWGIDVGGDYRLTDDLIVGGFLSYGSTDADFDDTGTAPGGDIESDSWGLALYGTYYKDRYYVDGLLGYTNTDYDMRRRIAPLVGLAPNGDTAYADTDSDGFAASVGGGMDFETQGWTYGPYGRLTYQDTEIDGYSESGALGLNLTVSDQDWESLTLVLGGRASYAISQAWGVLAPQGRFGYVHEFMDDSQKVSAVYTNDPDGNALITVSDDPDRNYFELGIGMSAVMQNGLQAFLDYQTLIGHEYLNDHTITLGIRSEL